MDDYLKKQTLQNLAKAQNVLVAISSGGDFDSLAGGLALYLSLKKFGKNVTLVGPSPKVSDAQKLYAVDKIGKTSPKKNIIISIENAIDKVDKVTYFLEGRKLKIVIHSLPNSDGPTKNELTIDSAAISSDFILAIGYKTKEDLTKEVTREQNISSEVWTLSINKDNTSQKFAQVNIQDPKASSICEMLTSLMQFIGLPQEEDIAFNLYQGISSATNMFSPILTTPTTLQVATYLLKLGAGKAGLADRGQKATQTEPSQNRTSPDLQITQDFAQQSNTEQPASQNEVDDYQINLPSQEKQSTPEQVEREEDKESWLKPPKIYKGSKSFDRES